MTTCSSCGDSFGDVPCNIKIRIGDTFASSNQYNDANGNPINLTTNSITVTASLVDASGNTILTLTVTPSDQTANPGQYSLSGNTTGLQPSTVFLVIVYNQGGIISSTSPTPVLLGNI